MHKPKPVSTLVTLGLIVEKYQGQTNVSLDAIVLDLNDRSIGLLMLLLALPNCFPTVPGESTLLSIPIMLLGLQLMFGINRLWLPAKLRTKTISYQTLKKTISSAQPLFRKMEKLIKPRLSLLQHPIAHRIAGISFFLQGLLLFLPIPFGNMVPGISIVLLALSLLEKDGVLYLLGIFVGALAFVAMNAAIGAAWYGFETALTANGTDIQHIGAALLDYLKKD